MSITRRDLGKLAIAALPASRLLLAKANSKFGGVQIGINVPYSFKNMQESAADILKGLDRIGVNAVELRSQPVESYLGAPVVPPAPRRGQPPMTPEQEAERKTKQDALNKWRAALPVARMKEFKKYYDDAGVIIDIVKFDGIDQMPPDAVDYCFTLAKALGATALSCEIPQSKTAWLGEFATKHKFMVGYHGHTNLTSPEAFGSPESWEKAMVHSKYNGINLDIGHFTAANNTSPIPFIKKHHDRITHVHLKDRKFHDGPNVPWGQGDTPIVEVLQLMKKEKYPFEGTIEFEYPVPQGSDLMTEITKCVEFCKNALV